MDDSAKLISAIFGGLALGGLAAAPFYLHGEVKGRSAATKDLSSAIQALQTERQSLDDKIGQTKSTLADCLRDKGGSLNRAQLFARENRLLRLELDRIKKTGAPTKIVKVSGINLKIEGPK